MSDFEYPTDKRFSRLTLGRAETLNARFQEVATAIATKLDKAGGPVTGDVSITGNFSTSGTFTAGGAATIGGALSIGGALDLNGFRAVDAANAVDPQDLVTLSQLTATAFSSALPSQAGNSGKFVTTNGLLASWASVYPSQTGNAGRVLGTDGTDTAWVVGAGQKQFTATGTLPNGATVVLNSDGTVSTVTSNPDTTGTATVFRSAATTYIASAALSATQVVVCYYDGAGVQSVIGTISGTSLSFGSTSQVLGGVTASYVSVCALSATSFCIAWQSQTLGRSIVGTVSGTTISFGSIVNFNAANTAFISIAALSSTAVVIAYQDTGNSSYGTAIIGTISGTTISFPGSEYVVVSGTTLNISVCSLSSTSFVFVSSDGNAKACSVSGTTITAGSGVSFDSAAAYTSIVALTSTTFMVAWARGTTDGRAKIGTVSGTTVSFTGASDVVFNAGNTFYVAASKISATSVLVAYMDNGNSNYGTLCVGTVSGINIAFGNEIVFKSANINVTFGVSCVGLTDRFFITYGDTSNSNYGTGVVFQPAGSNVANWIGITAAAIANGAPGLVTILGGVNASVSGLTTGATYYLSSDGTLTTTATSYKAGRALSASSLLITGSAQ